MKFSDGQKVTVNMKLAGDSEPRAITGTILRAEDAERYRVLTNMGITMLVNEADISAREAQGG